MSMLCYKDVMQFKSVYKYRIHKMPLIDFENFVNTIFMYPTSVYKFLNKGMVFY